MEESSESIVATLYDPGTGALLGVRTGPKYAIERDDFPHVLGSHDYKTHYVNTRQARHEIVRRPVQTVKLNKGEFVADGRDVVVFSELPVPCTVHIGNHHYEVEDGELEWGTLLPGSYRVRVEAFPYLDWETEVIAVAGGASPDTR